MYAVLFLDNIRKTRAFGDGFPLKCQIFERSSARRGGRVAVHFRVVLNLRVNHRCAEKSFKISSQTHTNIPGDYLTQWV